MNLFKKLFGKEPERSTEKQSENTRLIFLMNNWSENSSDQNYKLVMEELLHGNSFLILPTLNSDQVSLSENWNVAEQDMTLKLTSVYNLDGLKVLGVFCDEASLTNWSKTITPYTALKSQAVFELCKNLNINRIVVNSGARNMFVIQRCSTSEPRSIKQGSILRIGTPDRPLGKVILQNIVANFTTNENILEAYQYVQVINDEANLTIGLKLLSYSENAKKAALYAVEDALSNESKKTFVDIIFLDTEHQYDTVRNVEESLFYKKQ